MTEATPASLEARFAQLASEWASIVAPPDVVDETRFAAIKAEANAIVSAGQWTSGPSDLLTILGRHRDELMHSRVLGWLMTPTGRHGLGSAFLRAFLGEIWPEDRLIDDGPVTVALELTQSGESGMTGEILEARADIVIRTGSLVVVVENKVGASEQPRQCERLYWAWANEPIETRWIYLTPSGRKPISAESGVARDAWACLSYPGVRRALGVALEEATGDDRVRGRESARQYLWTLEAHA